MLTAAPEPWRPFIEEVQPMLPLHWDELALNKDQVPLDPQYHVYDQRDQAGQVMVVTLRDAGELVGYFIGFVAPGLHYQTCLTLHLDIFWVRPDKRNGTSGMRLLKAVEKEARRRGVQRMFVGSKVHADASRLFKALGYQPVETVYSVYWPSEEAE